MSSFVARFHRCASTMARLGSIALPGVLLVLATACGGGAGASATISLAQAEQVRDECVGEGLRLLQQLADRVAPLARASGPEEREAIALGFGCTTVPDGFECFELGIRLAYEERLDGFVLMVHDLDPLRGVTGEFWVRTDPERGLVLQGHLHRAAEDGCLAILTFDELVGLEAYGLPDGELGLFFSEGAVDVSVRAPDDSPLAYGSAALSGRHALVALNFEGRRLLDELALD